MSVFHHRYWWIYGINFIIYLLTCQRIRDAFARFFNDISLMICQKGKNERGPEEISSFWADGMENNDGNHDLTTLSSPENLTLRENSREAMSMSQITCAFDRQSIRINDLEKDIEEAFWARSIYTPRMDSATRDKNFECPQDLKRASHQIQRRTL